MDQDELVEFQKIFALVNTLDPLSLREWFNEYPELTPRELCQIADRSAHIIRKWRRRAGLTTSFMTETLGGTIIMSRKAPDFKMEPKAIPDVEIPKDWRTNRHWVLKQVDELGISRKLLAKSIGCKLSRISKSYHYAKNYISVPDWVFDLVKQ